MSAPRGAATALALPPRGLPADVPVTLSLDWCWWPAGALVAARPASPSAELLGWLATDRQERWAMWQRIAASQINPRGDQPYDAAAVKAKARELATQVPKAGAR